MPPALRRYRVVGIYTGSMCCLLGAHSGVDHHVVPFHNFLAFAVFFVAEVLLVGFECVVALPRGHFDAFVFEECEDGVGVGGFRCGEHAVGEIFEEAVDGLVRVAFGVTD